MSSTQDYHPQPSRTEHRILLIARPGQDYLADAWNNKRVLVVGWYLGWLDAGTMPNGRPCFKPKWMARVLELPDRRIPEEQLRRIL